MSTEDRGREVGLERAISRVLRAGIVTSSACLAVGFALTLSGFGTGLAQLLLSAGLVVLLVTPPARVLVSFVEYASEHDWLFTSLTLIVLLELAASVVAATFGLALL